MTKQEMMNKMVKDFGMENEHVINFFRWCENNPNAKSIDVMDAYNENVSHAVREILDNSVRVW